jgi:RNA polymerase sigma factor (sigma-70 family)
MAWSKSNDDAKELTQAFLLWLMEGDTLERYEPGRASFRTYLKSLLRHFLQHQDEALRRLKRGGHVEIFSLSDDQARFPDLLPDPKGATPEEAFDQAWLAELLFRALGRVRERWLNGGAAAERQFKVFECYDLIPPSERPTYAELAQRFGIKATDVQNYLFTVREAVRSELRAEVGRTTSGEDSLRDEWNGLFGQR